MVSARHGEEQCARLTSSLAAFIVNRQMEFRQVRAPAIESANRRDKTILNAKIISEKAKGAGGMSGWMSGEPACDWDGLRSDACAGKVGIRVCEKLRNPYYFARND